MSGTTETPTPSETSGLSASLRAIQARVVVAATVGGALSPTPALLSVYGVVMVPIAEEFDWPRAQVAGVLGIAALLSAMTLAPLGWLLDRIGPRRIVLFGIATFATAMAAFTLSPPEVGPYYALFILTVFFGTFTTPIIYSRAVAGWFEKGRGSALGFSSGVGNGAGAALIPILAGLLLAHYGWRGAYQGVALLVFLLGFPVVFFCLRDPPRSARPGETNDPGVVGGYRLKAALKTRTFWVMALAIGVCASCLTAMFTQIVPVALSRGLSLAQGITIITVFSLTCAGWQWVMGLLLDRIQAPWILMPFYALAAIGLLLLQYGDSDALLVLSGVLMGLGLGAEYSALPLMASRYFGLRNYGQIVLLIYSGIAIFRGLVPWLINLHFDVSGSYNLSLHIIQGVLILAAGSLVLLPRLSKGASAHAS